MAKFTRAEIRRIIGENCTDEMENALIALHIGVVDPMKDDIARYKADADKLPGVQKELNDLKAEKDDGEDFKTKYENLKAEVARKEESGKKTAAYRELLKEAGISDKRIETVLKVSSIDGVKLNDKGEIENKTDLMKSIKADWADFITTKTVHGVQTETPPTGGEVIKSRADIYATDEHGRFKLDANQRQAELAKIIANEQKG